MMVDYLLDDFVSRIKDIGSGLWNTAKQFVTDNKEPIRNGLSSILTRYLGPIGSNLSDLAFSAFGGKVMSEDPYAIDEKYIRSLYSLGALRYAPRKESHYMASMQARV